MNRILVLDPESPASRRIIGLLETKGYLPIPISEPVALQQYVANPAVVLCDVRFFRDALAQTTAPTVVLDGEPSISTAIASIKAGAADYLPADVGDRELTETLERAFSEQTPDPIVGLFPMVGVSALMKVLLDSVSKVAPTDSTVLITGESGTGKELVARALHAGSLRRYAPLISLNCATVPENLIEAELFGHPGEESRGLLATAASGTLFLDEIGELPAAAQSRLLQVLESTSEVRLISATHRDLKRLATGGQFRTDLYYRLKVVSLDVPPLRERGEDVQLLADAILARTQTKLGKSGLEFTDRTREDMRQYPWPGNVRELENAIQRAVILCDNGLIDTELLAIEPPKTTSSDPAAGASPDQTIEDYFVSFVTTHQDTMTETEIAEKLGISRKSLWERRQRLDIPRKKTKKRGRRRDVS